MIKLDLSHARLAQNVGTYQEAVNQAHKMLHEKSGAGNDFLGWLDWPLNYDKEELEKILKTVKNLEGQYDTVVVCGIGGSYLGARAAVEMLKGLYPLDGMECIFVGNTFSAPYIAQVLEHLKKRNVVLNVISKSGTTTETAVAFRIFEKFMIAKYGDEAQKRILVTTDKVKGTLKTLADDKGYTTFAIPDDIGGRYSVSTAVGLLPLALLNVDIKAILESSKKAYEDLLNPDLSFNTAYAYAVARRILDKQGYASEMFVTYHLQLTMVAEWWKQLFGESEGKEGLGLLPTSACFSTDLHSLGQFIQEGRKILFETVLDIAKMPDDVIFPDDDQNLDTMNYLSGKKLSWVNHMAMEGTLAAHSEEGRVPNIVITLEEDTAFGFGYMIYFFFKACAMSCYLLDINPFNQPGVEVYKRKMFKLLGKE